MYRKLANRIAIGIACILFVGGVTVAAIYGANREEREREQTIREVNTVCGTSPRDFAVDEERNLVKVFCKDGNLKLVEGYL